MEWSPYGGKLFTIFLLSGTHIGSQRDSIYTWLYKFILVILGVTCLSFIISSLSTYEFKNFLIILIDKEISIRIKLCSRKGNYFKNGIIWKFRFIIFAIVVNPVLNVEGISITRSTCSQEMHNFLSHRLMNWRDDLIKQFAKQNPLILENN